MLKRWQAIAELLNHGTAVNLLAAVGDAISGNQHFGFNLFEAVKHSGCAHVRCANAPHTANTDGGQKRHHGLRNIGQVSGHAVAGLNALRFEMQGEGGHLLAQLRPSDFTRRRTAGQAFLVVADDGWQTSGMSCFDVPEYLLNIVDLCTFKPPRTRHLALYY